MMTCPFCHSELKDDYDPSGQPYGKVSCRNHNYGDRPLHLEFTRKTIYLSVAHNNSMLSYQDELTRADLTFNYPIEDELSEKELWLTWDLETDRFQMCILDNMGDFFKHDYLLHLPYLPDWITPETAYPTALKILKNRAFA